MVPILSIQVGNPYLRQKQNQMGQKAVDAYSYSAYLAMEAEAELKHEYHDGLITALAGGTPVHGQLAANFGGEVVNALKVQSKPCRTYSSDTRIRIDATNRAYYPDFSVVCEQPLTSPDDQHAITNPILILEVLSESTAGFDRGTKFSHYRQIDSLREYVLISQEKAMVDTFYRTEEGLWEINTITGLTDSVHLKSLDCILSMADIYRLVDGLEE